VSEAIPGVLYVNVTEFRRGDKPTPAVDPAGKIELAANEVPTVPGDAAYAGGIQVVVTNQGGL